MPYICPEVRKDLMGGASPQSKGELNYLISMLMIEYMLEHGRNYQRLSDCISACNDAAEEFRRRVLNPYEDEKILENGDIYPEGV